MKPSRVIQGTFLSMVAIQTIGSIDSEHRLPAPKQYVAITVLWGILFLMADTTWNRIAARLSVLVALTGLVVGPAGKLVIDFLNTVAREFAPTQIRERFGNAPAPPAPDDTGATQA